VIPRGRGASRALWDVTSRAGARAALLMALVTALVLLGVPAAHPATANPGTVIAGGAGRGSGPGQLARPEQLALDPQQRLAIADSFNNRAVRWVPATGTSGAATVLGGGALGGLGPYPAGVAVDAAGRVFVADTFNHRVVRFDPGAAAGVVVAGGPGTGDANAGPDPDRLNNPTQLALTADGNLYITDTANDRVLRWPPGATQGLVVAGGQGRGTRLGQLALPVGLAVDGAGNLWVGDTQNHRVLRYDVATGQPAVAAGGTGAGAGSGQLSGPTGLAVAADGTLFVADTQNHRVMRWSPGARSGQVVAGGRGDGGAANQLDLPVDVALDATGGLLVSDRDNDRVLRVAAGGVNAVAIEPPSPPGPTADPAAVVPTLTPTVAAPYVTPDAPFYALDPQVVASIIAANGGFAIPLTPSPTPPLTGNAVPQPLVAQGFPTSTAPTTPWSRPLAAPRGPSGLPLTGVELLQLLVLGGGLIVGGIVVVRRTGLGRRRR